VKYTRKTATELKGIVEVLLHYKDNGIAILDKRTAAWIESASAEIREKLAKAGLIELAPSHTLKNLWDSFLEQKARELKAGKIKETTRNLYDFISKRFFLFFAPNESLANLTKDRMQQWKEYLLDEVAEATVACYIKETKACFNWGVSQGWIGKSPLDGVSPGSFVNKKNVRMIPMDSYYRLLDACPCQDWRVIIALARIGGLRWADHYLMLTDDDFQEASRWAVSGDSDHSLWEPCGQKSGRKVPDSISPAFFPAVHGHLGLHSIESVQEQK